jgi:hypothetical protein
MAFNPLHISLDRYKELEFIVFDNNSLNINMDNLFWKIPEEGVHVRDGYYAIPGNPKLLINKECKIINYTDSSEVVVYYPNKNITDRYPQIGKNVNVDKFNNPYITNLVHRLVAFAFIPIKANKDSMMVNHKDGNKNNFSASNLEWVTYSENRLHAINTGLCVQSQDVFVLNTVTNEKMFFNSFQAASKQLNIHAWDIKRAIDYYEKYGKCLKPPFLFSRVNNFSIKPSLDAAISSPIYFKVLNNKTNGIMFVKGRKNLSKIIKTKQFLNNEFINEVVFNNYVINKVNENEIPKDVLQDFRKPWSNHGGKTQKTITVTNLANGEVNTYKSTDEFAALVGAKRKTIQRGMLYKNGVWGNFKIAYNN